MLFYAFKSKEEANEYYILQTERFECDGVDGSICDRYFDCLTSSVVHYRQSLPKSRMCIRIMPKAVPKTQVGRRMNGKRTWDSSRSDSCLQSPF